VKQFFDYLVSSKSTNFDVLSFKVRREDGDILECRSSLLQFEPHSLPWSLHYLGTVGDRMIGGSWRNGLISTLCRDARLCL
jgi:hypothetical protein